MKLTKSSLKCKKYDFNLQNINKTLTKYAQGTIIRKTQRTMPLCELWCMEEE